MRFQRFTRALLRRLGLAAPAPPRPAFVAAPLSFGLHEPISYLRLCTTLLPPGAADSFLLTGGLHYAGAVAKLLESGPVAQVPTCTLAHVVAAVVLIPGDLLLPRLRQHPGARQLLAPYRPDQLAQVVGYARQLCEPYFAQVGERARERVLRQLLPAAGAGS